MNAPLALLIRREREWSIPDQINSAGWKDSATAVARRASLPFARSGSLAGPRISGSPATFGFLAHPRRENREFQVSGFFPRSSKRETYDAWVDFHMVPAFMRGSQNGTETELIEVPWYLNLGRDLVRWEARTTEHLPGDRIGWQTEKDAPFHNSGTVTFVTTARTSTRVDVNVRFDTLPASGVTKQTVSSIESRLRDALVFLRTFMGPLALPPAVAYL